jgi:hypothetical protein
MEYGSNTTERVVLMKHTRLRIKGRLEMEERKSARAT